MDGTKTLPSKNYLSSVFSAIISSIYKQDISKKVTEICHWEEKIPRIQRELIESGKKLW